MELQRGLIYTFENQKSTFIPALKISEATQALNKTLIFTPEKLEQLTSELYTIVANYNINSECCWLKLIKADSGYALRWGISPVSIFSLDLINAAYYIWKQACVTPEEAAKSLNISVEDLMQIAETFDKNSDTKAIDM